MSIADTLQRLQQRMDMAMRSCDRNDAVRLLAVSKGQDARAIRAAFAAGQRDFGESYWQEAQKKQDTLQDLAITWHFIGPIQSNKAADIARRVDWVHSVDREKIANLLSQNRPANAAPLNVCVQVNLDHESTKSGVSPEQLPEFLATVRNLPGLTLRGLMAIPQPRDTENEQYESLLRLTRLRDALNHPDYPPLDTLSMGMSDDLLAAIRAGSTMVRIGRALFGERS